MSRRQAEIDVAVVGGGVIGVACAYYLSRRGLSVRVLEQGRIGSGASHANCGLVTPSHAAPLTQPGMPAKALKMMLDPRSPFRVTPRIGLADLPWFVRMARACGRERARRSMEARAALLNSSRLLYDALFDEERLDCRWETVGLLEVYLDPAVRAAYDRIASGLAEVGVSSISLDGDELRRRDPALRDAVCGGRWFEDDAHLRPDLLVAGWSRAAAAAGARFWENRPVSGFEVDGETVVAVRVGDETVRARRFVVAAGAWSPRLQRDLAISIPVRPGKGYSITFSRPEPCARHPMLLRERSVAVTPWSDGYRLGGTMEFAGYDRSLNEARLAAIRDGAGRYLRAAPDENERSAVAWTGWRPMSPDEVPFIGPSPRHRNLLIATGHGMLGVSMATGTGKMIAELIAGDRPHVDPRPYAVDR